MSGRMVWAWLAVGVLTLLSGCSGPTAKMHAVSGRLLDNGNPWKPAEGQPPGDVGVRVEFCLLDAANQVKDVHPTVINPKDGTFNVTGLTGQGLPEGKYRVVVHVGAFGQPDKLKGALSKEKSPLTIDVPGSGEVVIDIGKKSLVK